MNNMTQVLGKTLVFNRQSIRNLNQDKLQTALDKIKNRLVTDGRSKRGWSVESLPLEINHIDNSKLSDEERKKTINHTYTAKILLKMISKRDRREELVAQEWDHINEMLNTHLNNSEWSLVSIEDLAISPEELAKKLTEKPEVHVVEAKGGAAPKEVEETPVKVEEVKTEEVPVKVEEVPAVV